METKSLASTLTFVFSKYLTYKEWKRDKEKNTCHYSSIVSTLPIRNGNVKFTIVIVISNLRFCKYLTYKEWKPIFICPSWTLPLYVGKYLTYKEWKRVKLIILDIIVLS